MQLTRRFSPLTMLLLSINGMLGSAWLFGPLYAAKIAGSAAIISWLLGGLATTIIALTFAELSAMLPIAGGMARFSQLSHGTLTNMIMSWVSWLSCVTMPPIEVQATLQYASTYFPRLIHIVNDVPVLTHFGLFCAALLMIGLSLVNIAAFKGWVRFNGALFTIKVSIILITITTLIKTHFHWGNFQGAMPSATFADWEPILAAVASGGVAFAFTGFTHGIALAGETKHSQVAIPVAVIGSVLSCLLIYLGLQIAFIGALLPTSLIHGFHQLSFPGQAGPFVGLAGLLGLSWLVKLLYLDATFSPMGAGFIYVTSTARTVYAMSKNHYLPAFLSHLNHQGFPVWAIALNCLIGMCLFILPGWQAMVDFLVSAVVISYAMGPIALLCLRLQFPYEKRPFRLPMAKVLCPIAFYCCNLISYWTGWGTIWKLAIALSIGILLLFIGYVRGYLDKSQFGFRAILWMGPYLCGLVILSYLGSFGGTGVILFGWDFVIIGIFSIAILSLAIATRREAAEDQYQHYQQELGTVPL